MDKGPSQSEIKRFIDLIWTYHKHNRRDLPWRNTFDPYKILLSELMLQQTQVSRVIGKYVEFLEKFPTIESLHRSPVSEILMVWKGLGYNRRAYFIKKIADELNGNTHTSRKKAFPETFDKLITLPGIGPSTAGALVAFCFAKKTGEKIPFIETNIRTVLLRELFYKKNPALSKQKALLSASRLTTHNTKIPDKVLLHILSKILDRIEKKDIREWYYALYDYGTYLKSIHRNEVREINQKSGHSTYQSKFEGSIRQMRSQILYLVVENDRTKKVTVGSILQKFEASDRPRFYKALSSLIRDESIRIMDKKVNTVSGMVKPSKSAIISVC